MSGNRVLLVTGGSRGIGASVCRLAGQAGWQVVVNYASNREAAEGVVEDIRAAGGTAISVEGDVGTELGLTGGPRLNDAAVARQSILFLLSDAASYVTGAALNVSGGR